MRSVDKFVEAAKEGKIPGITADPYNPALAYEPMDLGSKSEQRVRFTGYGGYDSQQEAARKVLEVGGIYTVERVEVGDWSSSVWLKEHPARSFNTVMFENL
jgi:hypothetical protein